MMNRRKKNLQRVLTLLLFGLLLIYGCQRKAESPKIIARVQQQELSLQDVKRSIPSHPGLEISKVQVENYIQRWIEKELIYQEALKNRYHKLPHIEKKLHELERDYIVASYLEQLINKNVKIDSTDLLEYYEERKTEFIRKHDFYRVHLIIVDSYQNANKLRREVLDGRDFAKAAEEKSIDGSAENGGDLGWVRPGELSASLAKWVPRLQQNRISRPIKTEIGYALVNVTAVRKKDEPKTFEEVREEIRWRIGAQKRELLYRQLISVLSDAQNITTHWNLVDEVLQDSSGT